MLIKYLFLTLVLICSSVSAKTLNKQPVLGAGPSTAVVSLFFEHFSKTPAARDYIFEVEQRSIKHAGGIKASGKYLFGRTGRPLSEKEKKLGKQDIFIARIPLTMVAGKEAGVKNISMAQLKAILNRQIHSWKQIGGADREILFAGREDTEASFSALKNAYAIFRNIKFDRTFTRDHQIINFIKSTKGNYAISFGAKSNFKSEFILEVRDFEAGVNLGLVYDLKNHKHPLIEAVKKYALNPTWLTILKNNDYLPPE